MTATQGPAGFAVADSVPSALRVIIYGSDGEPVSSGGGGDASAAKQDVGNASLSSVDSRLSVMETLIGATNTALATVNTNLTTVDGHVDGLEGVSGTTADAAVITDANGTLSAKLRGIVVLLGTQAAYLDGLETLIGSTNTKLNGGLPAALAASGGLKVEGVAGGVAQPVTAGGYTVNSTATITRPADTTAYTAKDAVSSSTSAPAILTFTSCARASGGSGYVTSARVVTNQAACVSAFRLHLYDATLAAVNDNAAQTVLETNWGSSIGYIDFPAMTSDGSDTAASQSTDKPLPFVAAGTSLFGMLETITGFTPASAQHFQIKLGIEQN